MFVLLCRGSANVSPDDAEVVVELNENEGFAKGENSYESVKGENSYDSVKGDNNDAYDSVKPSESSASTSKPPEDISPPEDIAPPEANASAVYAAVDKENKQGKTVSKKYRCFIWG